MLMKDDYVCEVMIPTRLYKLRYNLQTQIARWGMGSRSAAMWLFIVRQRCKAAMTLCKLPSGAVHYLFFHCDLLDDPFKMVEEC